MNGSHPPKERMAAGAGGIARTTRIEFEGLKRPAALLVVDVVPRRTRGSTVAPPLDRIEFLKF